MPVPPPRPPPARNGALLSQESSELSSPRMSSIKQPQINDYVRLMRDAPTYEELTQLCISGELRTSAARAIVWRMLLKCLPLAREEWTTVLSRSRSVYDKLKTKHVTDPRMQDSLSLDPSINNPLSDAEHNPWRKFFEDGDLRELIAKDVSRTFPEMEFFQDERIRGILSDVLLVYAKENPYVSYKQGMHEILAPLLFVLFSDQQTYEHYQETGALSKLTDEERQSLQTVYDPRYLEHDSFSLFCEVMRDVSAWYEDGSSPTIEEKTILDPSNQRPFMRVQDAPATNRLMDELATIGDKLFEVDAHLHKHLSSLDIPPQLYGIRWLRLLFGREFPLHDLLFIWDVLFSQKPLTKFVHCMFVAMLMHIRTLLLTSDYSGCLQYLMRYPPVVDVSAFLKLVLHLRYPTKYSRPRDGGTLANYTHITVAGTAHPNQMKDVPLVMGRESPFHPVRPSSAGPFLHNSAPSTATHQYRQSNSIFGRARRKEPPIALDAAQLLDAELLSMPSSSSTPHNRRSPDKQENGSPSHFVAQAQDTAQLDALREALRESDERAADCARRLKKVAMELQGPCGNRMEERQRMSDCIIKIVHELSHTMASPPPCTKDAPPFRELQELPKKDNCLGADKSRNHRVACHGVVEYGSGGAGVVYQNSSNMNGLTALPAHLQRRSMRYCSTSSADSELENVPRQRNRTTHHKKLQKKVISCPVLFASRF